MTPIRIGIENKRQVYVFGLLFVVMVALAIWELQGSASGSSNSATVRAGSSDQRSSSSNLLIDGPEPKLQMTQLSHSEDVNYSAGGRDIFSVEAAPVPIEPALAPPRPVALPDPLPERPKPPAIDLKYLGYTQTSDKVISAVLARGDDSLVARSGEIIFHRFKVGPIQPTNVQITDLSANNTQNISVAESKSESAR